jgi:hypothetical protein
MRLLKIIKMKIAGMIASEKSASSQGVKEEGRKGEDDEKRVQD